MADGWEDVVVSEDLTLDKEQKGVNVAVDMSIAERAEVFVGNGVSLPVRSLIRLMSHCCCFPPLVFESFRGDHHATIVQRFTISSEQVSVILHKPPSFLDPIFALDFFLLAISIIFLSIVQFR